MENDNFSLQRLVKKIDRKLSNFDRNHLTGCGNSGSVVAIYSMLIIKAACHGSTDELCSGLTHPMLMPFVELNINAVWTIAICFYLYGIPEELIELMLQTRF